MTPSERADSILFDQIIKYIDEQVRESILKEREKCARIAETSKEKHTTSLMIEMSSTICDEIAAAIREGE